MAESYPFTNRLIHEKSPYLLQHAHNPVDWYPWGEEAFQAARNQDKPIFLSIGYATCHWCHVMERESFQNPALAKSLNETFINIKVDREELPEVDSLYMDFAQGMMSGAAGWPLNIILTPELQPFFAATYLPSESKHGFMGLKELIERIVVVWEGEEKESVVMQAAQVVESFAINVHAKGEEIPEREVLQEVSDILFRMADPIYGGMRGVPKFPIGYQYNFLLRYAARHKDNRAYFFVERSLDMMHQGGIYDHLAGGFSRYSVDERWQIPHFEKMLYDNALLVFTYLEGWKAMGNPIYLQVTRELLDYVLREMSYPEGGFYSAQDAETEGREGFYYTWSKEEIEAILSPEDAELFCEFYGVTEEGNFEGRNVLHTPHTVQEFANYKLIEFNEMQARLEKLRNLVWQQRNKRVAPFKDDKILTSWNGLMIFSMAEAGPALKEQRYLDAAVKAAQFIKSHLWSNGTLYRRWREGEVGYQGGLDDYAALIRALISLFEADCGIEWLVWAMHLSKELEEFFKEKEGAFYQTNGRDPHILVRKCQCADGAEPSGNSLHCENLLRLYSLSWNPAYLEQAKDIFRVIKSHLDSYAPGYCYHLINLDRYYDPKTATIVVALDEQETLKEEIRDLLYQEFLPHKSVIWRRENDEKLFHLIPFLREYAPLNEKTTLYICHEGVCQKPLTEFREMVNALHAL